jgi:AcrR family transcriptional regulator
LAAPALRVVVGDELDGASTPPSKRVQIVDGALCCIARHGVKRTTVEEIARESSMSRATLYRVFPGGRDEVLQAVVDTELARFFSAVAVALGTAETLDDVIVAGIHRAGSLLLESAALAALIDEDAWSVLRHAMLEDLDRTISVAAAFAEPFFGRFLEPDGARRGAELVVRVVLSYLIDPDDVVDVTDERSVRAFVRTFVLPGVDALRAEGLEEA